MPGKPQTLSEGQKNEVIRILRNRLLGYVLISFAILAGLTGLSLWGIWQRVEAEMEDLVAKQFKEPQIQEVVRQAAAEQASGLMMEQITPEVNDFKAKVDNQLKELYSLVATIQELKTESQKHEQGIQTVLGGLQHSLKQSQNQLSTVKSDIVEMQKHLATIQYYQIQGTNKFPNPYTKEMMAALNKLVVIAIPNPVERNKFITELRGTQEPKK